MSEPKKTDKTDETSENEDFDIESENGEARIADQAVDDLNSGTRHKNKTKDAATGSDAGKVPDSLLLDPIVAFRGLLDGAKEAKTAPKESTAKVAAKDSDLKSNEKTEEVKGESNSNTQARKDIESVKRDQEIFISANSTAKERSEALARMEEMLKTKSGAEAEELKKGIETNKAFEGLLGLQALSADFNPESHIAKLANPNTAEKAVADLAEIAAGKNGDLSQANKAAVALMQFVGKDNEFNPERAELVIGALLNGNRTANSERFPALLIASQLASQSGFVPEALHESIQDTLKSNNSEGKEAGFNCIRLLGQRASQADLAALQANLTPSSAKQILSLPLDMLSRDDGALVKAAVPKLENPASTFKGITEKTADDIAKLEKATAPIDAAAIKQNKELQSIAIAGLVETAQGKNANPKEAADAQAALVKLSENPALRNAIIEGIVKSQSSNDSSSLLPALGQIVANQKEGFESIGAGLKPDEKSQLQSTVRDAFEKGLKSTSPTDNRNAARGMAWFSGSLDNKSFDLIKNNMSLETANVLANCVKNFKPAQQEELQKDLIKKISNKDDDSRKSQETAVIAMGTLFGQKGLQDAGLEVNNSRWGTWHQPEQLIQARDAKSGSIFRFIQPLDERGSKHLLPINIEREPKANMSVPVSTEFKWQVSVDNDSWVRRSYQTDNLINVVEKFAKDKNGNEGTLLRDSDYRPTDSQWLEAMQVGHKIPEPVRKEYAGKMAPLIERSDYGEARAAQPPEQPREKLQQSPNKTTLLESDSRCTDAVQTITQVESLLKGNPENKVAQDIIIALGGVSSPADDRQKLIEANIQALSKEPDGLKTQLQSKDPSTRLQAMAKIEAALNKGSSAETLQNSLTDARLRSSSMGISPDSKPEVFDKFIEKTKADFERAAANGDRALATQLRDRYSWAGVSKLISELNNITEKDPAKASSQAAAKIEALLAQAQKGNPFAQTAVIMLVNSGDAPAQKRTQELSAKENGLALAIPNLQNLNQEAVQKLATGLLINKVATTNGAISKAEADALSAAFIRAEAKNDLETSRLLGAAIDLALNSDPLKVQRLGKETLELNGKQAVFEAMGSALKSGVQSDALVQRYLRAATTDNKMAAQVKEDLPALFKQAEQANQSAIKLLTGLAAFDKQNQQQATEYLKALAANEKTRESVLKAALNSSDSITGERAAGINLFKSLSGSASLSPETRQILVDSLKSANANDRREAAKALIAAASEHFKKADNGANPELALIKDNMNPEILAALLQTSGKQLLMNPSQFEKLGLSAESANGITTIKDAKNRTEYKVSAENNKVQIREFTRFDENNKAVLTRKNVYDPRSSEFKGAEELDQAGNRSRFDANNQLKEFFKAEPSNDFVKITRGADGKATSIYDNNGRAWDSSDGGKTWTKRPSDLKAYGLPEVQSDGSVKFSGKGPEGRVDVLQKADGTIEKYDDGRKESTSIKPDGSYTTKNDAGKIVKTRDSNGVEREFFWSPDNKQLTGVRDERGLWQASPDGTRWKNLSQNEDPEQEGTRSIDDNGYKVHISGEAVETSRLDGSRIETSADGQVDLINRRGERASLKYNGDDLQEVKENGNVWRRNEQNPEDKSLYLWKNGQPSDIKANFEVSKENGSIKRSLLDASKEQLDATNKPLYKDLQLNADGTMLARDDKGRIRESRGIGQERTEYQYLGDSDTLKFMLTRFPDGTAQSTGLRDEKQPEKGYIRHYHKEVSAGSPELKTIDPNKNNWEIASLSIDKTTGKIIANNVKVSVEIETGNANSPIADPRLKASSVSTNVHDQIQISLNDGIQSFQRSPEGKLRLNGSLNNDRSQERLDWSITGELLESKYISNPDGSTATLDKQGHVVKVEGLANQQSVDIKRSEDGSISISESGGSRWESKDGKTFVNLATGQMLNGEFFAKPNGQYGWKVPGRVEASITRDPSREETIFTPPERFQMRRLTPEVSSIALLDNKSVIQRDVQGRVLGVISPDGKITVAKRDAQGAVQELTVTDPRTEQSISWKQEAGKLTQTSIRGTSDLGKSKLELTSNGEIVQTSERGKIEFVRKPDGTEIKRYEYSAEFKGNNNSRYVLERPDGQITEYHYKVYGDGAAENLEVVKTGTKNFDDSLKADTVLRKLPGSDPNNPTWFYTDHADIRNGSMKMGQTWLGTQSFDPRSGNAESRGAKPGEPAQVIRTFADGWQQNGDGRTLVRKAPGGETVQKPISGQVEQISDRRERNIDIKYKDGQVSDIAIKPKGANEPKERYSSDNGIDWTRKVFDQPSNQWKEEKFKGNVSVSPEGVITVRKSNGSSTVYRPEGQSISIDVESRKTTVERTNGEKLTVELGDNGNVVKVFNNDGSYRGTDDGSTWRNYDAKGNPIGGEIKRENLKFDPTSGTLESKQSDGSRAEIIGGDGSKQIYQAVGPQDRPFVLTYDRNAKSEVTEVAYDNGKKISTTITDEKSKTVHKYNGDDLLVSMKNARGTEINIEWAGTPPNSFIKSFTDESKLKFERQNGDHFIAKNAQGQAVDSFDGKVWVNSEGKLERYFGTSSNIIGQGAEATKANIREIRGVDGAVLNLVEDKGVTVRNAEGLLERSITGNGAVRQFAFDGKDRWGQPQLRKITMGEGQGSFSYDWQHWYWTGDNSAMAPKWIRSDGKPTYENQGAHENQSWHVDHTTGDMFCYRNDFRTEHFNLANDKWTVLHEAGTEQKANEVKTIADRWRIQYITGSRFNDLNAQLQDLSADQIQAVKDNLMSRGLNIGEYVNNKWNKGSTENTVLNGHLRRTGFTRDVHNVEMAELAITRAMSERADRNRSRSILEVNKDLREKVSPLNQKQLNMLNTGYAAAHDGKTVLQSMQEDTSWKYTSDLHKTAMTTYLTTGKGNRSLEDELKLAKMAAEYLPPGYPPGLADRSLDKVRPGSRDFIRQRRLEFVQEFLGEGRVEDNVRQTFTEDPKLGKKLLEQSLLVASERKASGNYVFENGITVGQNDPGRVMTLALDAMRLGKTSESTQMELGNWGTGNSNADIKKIFDGMKEDDRRRIQLGMDLRMSLDGPGRYSKQNPEAISRGKDLVEKLSRGEITQEKLSKEQKLDLAHFRRAEAQAVLNDPKTAWAAKNALDSYDQLYKTAGRQSMFDARNTRYRNEYLQSAAGAGFSQEMGDKNISMMWWNSSKDEHMKTVENMDERSYTSLTANRHIRSLNDKYMEQNFKYERGEKAKELIDQKLHLSDDLLHLGNDGKDKVRLGKAFGEEQKVSLKDLLPKTRNISQATFDQLIADRKVDKEIETGQKLQDQIDRGKRHEQVLKEGEQLTKLINEGTKKETQLNTKETEALALFRRSQKPANELSAEEKLAESLSKAAVQKYHDSLLRDGQDKLSPAEKKSLEALANYNALLKVEEQIKDGQKLFKNIEEGRHIAETLAGRANLSHEQKEQLALFDKFSGLNGKLADSDQANLALFKAWQRTQGTSLLESFSSAEKLNASLVGKNPEERAKARIQLNEKQIEDLAKFNELKDGEKLNGQINEGRKLSLQIAAGKTNESSLNEDQREQLSLYKQYSEASLSKNNKYLLEQYRALESAKAEPSAPTLNPQSAQNIQSMQTLQNLQSYREDKTGLRVFLDGRDLARSLDSMSTSKQIDALRALDNDPSKAGDKFALESYRHTVYELAKDNIRRDISEVLTDVNHTFSADFKSLQEAIINMKPAERQRYATNESYRAEINTAVEKLLSNYPNAKQATLHLLDQIKTNPNKAPEKDVIFDLFSKSADGKISAREAALSIQEAFNGPNGKELARKLDEKSADYDANFAKSFEKAWKSHFPAGYLRAQDEFRKMVIEPIKTNGFISLATLRDLSGGIIEADKLARELLKLNDTSREKFLIAEKDHLGTYFSGERKTFVETILAEKGPIGVEDKLRAIHLGIIPSDDLIKTLGEIKSMDERRSVVNNYASKYKSDCLKDMVNQAASADLGRVENALKTRDLTSLEQLYRAQDHSARITGTGWGTRGWNSTAYQLDNRMGELSKLIGNDNAQFRETDQAKIDEHLGAVWDAQAGVVETQKQMANVARDIGIAVFATALTIGSGGTMSWAAIAMFTMAAAGASAGMTKWAMGGNARMRDLEESAKDGAKSALIQSIGPGHIQKICGMGKVAAQQAAGQLLKEAAFKGLSEAEKKIVQAEIEQAVVKALRDGVQSASKKGFDQQINHAAMEVLRNNKLTSKIINELGQEGAKALETSFNSAAQSAVRSLGESYVQKETATAMERALSLSVREGKSLMWSHGAATFNSVTVETLDMLASGKINLSNIGDGSFLTDASILKQYGDSLRGGNLAAGGGHLAGRLAHHLVNPEVIANRLALTSKLDPSTMRMVTSGFLDERSARLLGNASHFGASGMFMAAGMTGANTLNAGYENLVHGKAASPTENLTSFIQYGIAPFMTGVHTTFKAAQIAPVGQARFGLQHEASVKTSEPLKGTQFHEKPVVKYDSPVLEATNFSKPAVIENGKGSISGGTVELRGQSTKITANVPKGETLKVVVSDPAAIKNFDIAKESQGKVEFVLPDGHPATRELVMQHMAQLADGRVEIKALSVNGEARSLVSREMARSFVAQTEQADGLAPLWRPERNLSGSELAKLSQELGVDAGKLADAATAQKYLDTLGKTLESVQDSARQAAEKYEPFKQNFDKAKLAIESELAKEGLSLPQDKDFSEASLRTWAGNNNERNQLVDKLLETRKANGDAIKEFNRQLDTELQKVEDAINRFNSQEGNPPVKLKRFGDVQVGDASYRDGVIKVNTEDMANNPAKFLINTYHENAHVSQDAEVLRYIRQEMAAKEFGISSDKVTAEQLAKIKPEQVAAQYAAMAQHNADPANQKQWQSFVEKALNSPPLSKESLVRAENIVKSMADMANQTGPTDVEIRRDYSSIRDAKRFMVSETGVGAQELLLILNKAAQGDGTALNLAQRLMGADAENLLKGNANDSKSGAAKDSSSQTRVSAIKELVELAKQVDITKPNANLETRARAAFDKLFESRVAQLNEQMTEAYGQYMRTHEKDALAAENYLRRVGADFLSKLSKDSRIALPTEVLGGQQNGQNQMASFHSEQVKAQEAISSVLKALDKPAPKAQAGSVANAANALELTRKGLEQLNDLIIQGKVNPETAKHLAELAYQMRGSAPLSPEIIAELAKLNPASAEKLLNELPIKVSKDLVDAVKFRALNAEQLENALSGSNIQSSASNSLAPHMAAIELLRVSPKERSIEQARNILDLKQPALDSMFKNPSVTPAGLEAVLKAMEGKSSGNEALDSVLNKQSLNQMIASQKDAAELISQLALLAGKQLEGKTNLSAETVTAFAKLDHTSASYARQLTGDPRISDSTLQKAFADLAALKGQSAGIELSINYFSLASKSPETFEKLMQLDDASLRQSTASAATKEAGKLNAELIDKIASLGAHSEQMKDLLNKILSQPRAENTLRFGQIEDLARAVSKADGLRAEDAAAIKKAWDAGLITGTDFGQTLKRPSLQDALHFAELGLIKDSDTFRSFASASKADAQAIKSALEKGQIANSEALQKLLSIDNSEGHAGRLLAILRSEAASTKAALSSADLQKLMDSADLTFEHSLTIDPRFHQAPAKAQMQQEMAKMRDALTEHISPETKENLTSFIRNFDESSPNAQARMKMLEDLSSAVKENPAAPKEAIDIVADGLNIDRGGLTQSTFMIDAFIRRPDGANTQKAIQELASHFTVKSPGQNVQASMLGVPGWKPVIDTGTGRPLTSNGKTVYENSGRVTVSSAEASKFDAALFRKVAEADGKVVLELKKPIRLAASIDDVLVSTIHANSVGKANCANCNRALLRNLADLQTGARKLDDARLAAPEAQALAHVTSFNYDKTGVSAALPFETLVMEDFKKLQPGVYRAETVAAFQQSSNHSEFHTFTIVAPADGGAPYILDASNGQRQSIDTYGTRLKLEKLSLEGTRTSLEIPGQKPGSTGKNAGEMQSWNTADANAPLDRTAIKSILDQAASTKNDSLHPESRNAAATRQMYETHLQNGTISPIELQKLLKLPSEDRGLIETLLKGQKLSQKAFSDLMKLEPKSIEQIFSLPANDYDNAMKFLENRVLDSQSMDRLMAMNSLERKVAFEFIQKAASDSNKTISAESIALFVSLHHADRNIIARALSPQTKGVVPLSPEQINLALSVPTVTLNEGHQVSYASSLVQGMQKGLITQDQIKTFASFDPDARAGYSSLLRGSTLNAATAKQLFEMIRTEQIPGTAVQDLSSAAIRGWVTDKSLGSILTTEPIVRDAALRSIHEVPREQTPNLTETIHRLSFLNELRKQSIITETSMKDLSVPQAHDLIVNPLLMAEKSKPAAERVAPESIQKLLELSKSAAISPDTLEAYRAALSDGILDRNSLNAMLSQSPEIRAAAETFMKGAPAEFAKLLREGKFNEMHSRRAELSPAASSVFPDMFPEGSKFDFKAPDVPSQKQVIKDISEMLTRMNSGDFKGALALMESNTVTPELHTEVSVVPKIQWVEKRISLADLNNGQALKVMLDFMKSQGHAYGTQTQSNNPNAISHQISAADPIVELPGGKQFRLRDASKIYDDHKWRTASPNERALIESIQQTPSGKAMLGKTAMIVMEEWAHTTQSTTGGISRFTGEFQMSPEFTALKTFWSDRIPDAKQREATINEALREIDIAASLRESGLSTDGVKKILGDQHLAGEREFFYRFLERTQKESKPAAAQKSMEMASIKDTAPTLNAEQLEAANKLIAFLEKPRKVAGFTFEQGFKSGLGKNAELDKTLEFFLLSSKTWNAESEANKSVLRDYLRAKFQEKYESKAAESAPKSKTKEADYESGKIFQSDLSAEVVKSKGKPVTLAKFIEDLGSHTTGETKHNLKEHHNLEDYATAIQDSPYKDMKPVRVLGAGFESVAILMENGMVLKLTRDVLGQSIDHEDWGSRKFDSPLYGLNEEGKLEKGIQHELDLPGEAKLFVYMQPKAETNEDKIGAHPGLKSFLSSLPKQKGKGAWDDTGFHQFGIIYEGPQDRTGRLVLLDYGAVDN